MILIYCGGVSRTVKAEVPRGALEFPCVQEDLGWKGGRGRRELARLDNKGCPGTFGVQQRRKREQQQHQRTREHLAGSNHNHVSLYQASVEHHSLLHYNVLLIAYNLLLATSSLKLNLHVYL
jgi:hypothetical protein